MTFNSDSNTNVDIIKKVVYIERLKCSLLTETSKLFESMVDASSDVADKKDILSDLLVLVYLLSGQIGVSFGTLEAEAVAKLKNEILGKEDSPPEIKALLHYLTTRSSKF